MPYFPAQGPLKAGRQRCYMHLQCFCIEVACENGSTHCAIARIPYNLEECLCLPFGENTFAKKCIQHKHLTIIFYIQCPNILVSVANITTLCNTIAGKI